MSLGHSKNKTKENKCSICSKKPREWGVPNIRFLKDALRGGSPIPASAAVFITVTKCLRRSTRGNEGLTLAQCDVRVHRGEGGQGARSVERLSRCARSQEAESQESRCPAHLVLSVLPRLPALGTVLLKVRVGVFPLVKIDIYHRLSQMCFHGCAKSQTC